MAYLLFDGEQHGFRRAENMRRALDAELSFYAQVLGFPLPPDEGIEPVEVENLADVENLQASSASAVARLGGMTNERPPIRIGTAERTAAMKALDEHLAAGRLQIEEYGERSALAVNAVTAPELAALFDDLPAPHPPLPGVTGPPARGDLPAGAAGPARAVDARGVGPAADGGDAVHRAGAVPDPAHVGGVPADPGHGGGAGLDTSHHAHHRRHR